MPLGNHIRLPPEIFEEILLYLNLEDILSCSLVCVGWRHAVNTNRVWDSLCKRKIVPLTCRTISSEDRHLYCSRLEDLTDSMPLCEQRKSFMDYLSLKRNWRTGRLFDDYLFLEEDNTFSIETDCEYVFRARIARDFSIFFTLYKIDAMGVYEIEESFTCSHIYNGEFANMFKLDNDVLVTVQKNLMQVFTKDIGYGRKLVAFFDEDPHGSKPVSQALYGESRLDESIEGRCDHNGKYFIGLLRHREDGVQPCSVFHLWDLESLTKIKEINIPEVGLIDDIHFSLQNHIIGMKIRAPDLKTTVCIYELKNMCYSSTVICRDFEVPIVLFTDSMVILSNESLSEVSLYDLTGGWLATLRTPELEDVDFFFKVYGNLLVSGGRYLERVASEVRVFDVSKVSQVEIFRLPDGKHFRSLHVHMGDLMIISTGTEILVRDLKTRTFTCELPYGDFVPPSPTCTQMIVRSPERNQEDEDDDDDDDDPEWYGWFRLHFW